MLGFLNNLTDQLERNIFLKNSGKYDKFSYLFHDIAFIAYLK